MKQTNLRLRSVTQKRNQGWFPVTDSYVSWLRSPVIHVTGYAWYNFI